MLLKKKLYWSILLCSLFTSSVCLSTGSEHSEPVYKSDNSAHNTHFGFSPFPYAFDSKAVKHSFQLANENGNIYVVQRDNGIPWEEALQNDRPYPKKVQDSWREHLENKPEGRPVYLALAPLAEDRVNLIAPSEGSSTSSRFVKKALNDEDVKTAYMNYVRRAVEYFEPDYLNIGLEVGELAHRKPRKWSDFVELYLHVRNGIKMDYPGLAIGISFGLQTLMDDSIQNRVDYLVKNSDFIGISFYPYMSTFHEKFGANALAKPPMEWRDPLSWLGEYSKKVNVPIAISETGYSSKNVNLNSFDLSMAGSEDLQQQYLTDLSEFASEDNYLFVIWFMTVDYEKLFEKLNVDNDAYLLWQNIGFFDQHLKPKPAWSIWQQILVNSLPNNIGSNKKTSDKLAIGFTDWTDLFNSSSQDKVKLVNYPGKEHKAMHWSFEYKKGRFQWLAKSIASGELTNKSTINLDIMSNQDGPVLLQLEENTGEAFYTVIYPSEEVTSVSISMNDMIADEARAKNRKLDPHLINKILIADAGAVTENANGNREVWISRLFFDSK
jgi:hypothetical protein